MNLADMHAKEKAGSSFTPGDRVKVIKKGDRREGWVGTVRQVGPEPGVYKVALDLDVAAGVVPGKIGTSFFARSLQAE